ncbi:hypothetical protein SASPL_124557 [Salvia splendens]|uniref:DUF7731 domain-containing protein n=1 Tax=Salvia splendens TaxID=180675 RepID=A0A8X8XFH9_SALSN|nr:uncharacterized protein LOC121746403 [Salvia splendens]KAG6411904.1 hypothetical protein SASPL_124557 [Salvia splendens]
MKMASDRQRQFLGGALLFIALFLTNATAIENKKYPAGNQNLNPTQAWRSSEYCLQNVSTTCKTGFGTKNYSLTYKGWLNVTAEEGPRFCEAGGCADHTRSVLLCLKHVKRDYWFANAATVQDLYDTIDEGCKNGGTGFTGISKYGSHWKVKSK